MLKKVLLCAPSWVGDTVISHAAILSLRAQGYLVDVLAPIWSFPVLAKMPGVNNSYCLEIGHGELALKARVAMAKLLAKNNYQQAIVLPNTIKSALIPFLAKVPVRTGFRGEFRPVLLNDRRKLQKDLFIRLVDRYVFLTIPADANPFKLPKYTPKLEFDGAARSALMMQFGIKQDFVGFAPGASYGPAKMWPIQNFITLGNMLSAKGQQIVMFGSHKDSAIIQAINHGLKDKAIDLSGKINLESTVDLVSGAKHFITNDSGLMHIACALGVKTIAIYGSSSPNFTPPLASDAVILYKQVKCSPCFARKCRFSHYECLTKITPFEVFGQMETSHAHLGS